jgi:hypothetical protein
MQSDSFAVSGAECVVALCQLGLVVARREPGRTILRSGQSIVVVPDLLVLPATVFDTIVDCARVSHAALLSVLEDLPTQPELRCLEA